MAAALDELLDPLVREPASGVDAAAESRAMVEATIGDPPSTAVTVRFRSLHFV